jgi:hypothetical protein
MHGEGIVQTTNPLAIADFGLRIVDLRIRSFSIRNPKSAIEWGAAKAVVVRKSVGRKAVRVRVPPSVLTVSSMTERLPLTDAAVLEALKFYPYNHLTILWRGSSTCQSVGFLIVRRLFLGEANNRIER